MGLTKNWKRLNLIHAFYKSYFFSNNNNSLVTFPFYVKIADGSLYQPKYGCDVNQESYTQEPNVVYGCLRYDAGTQRPSKALGGFNLAIGSGTRRFSDDDFALESEITSIDNSAREADRSKNICIVFNGLTDNGCVMEICGTNNTENTWNINEVGIYSWIASPNAKGSSGDALNIRKCLIFREVLPQTLTVAPNKQYSIKFNLSI